MGRSTLFEYSLMWLVPLVWSGYKRRIGSAEDDRIPELPAALKSEKIVPEMFEAWEKECKNSASKKKSPSLFMTLVRLSTPYIWGGMLGSLVQGLVTTVVRPLLIRALVTELANDADQATLMTYVGYLALALLAEGYAGVMLKHALSDFIGSLFFTTTTSLLARKALRVPSDTTSLQITSLFGNDIIRTYEALRFFCIFFMAVFALIGGIVVLFISIGLGPSFVGLALMVIILVINAWIAKHAAVAEEEDLAASDVRLSLMRQVILGIKPIKMSSWEDQFLEQLKTTRQAEMKCLGLYRTLHQTSVQLGRACPVLCAGASFIYVSLNTPDVSAADLFAALNVFLALRLPLIVIPECVTYFGALNVSLGRLQRYLSLEEVDIQELREEETETEFTLKGTFAWHGGLAAQASADSGLNITAKNEKKGTTKEDDVVAVEEGDAISFRVEPSEKKEYGMQRSLSSSMLEMFYLNEVDIRLPKNSRCAVIGPVGSGKSSFCCALLGELKSLDGDSTNTFARYRTGFVPQSPFVLSGTIKENVTFSRPSNDEEIRRVLKRSALEQDLRNFPAGLKTAVGENGVTLSGGQKARLCLARAMYDSPSLLVLDDFLAAVDSKTGDHLVRHVIDEKPDGTTLVVALNQMRYLDHFDYVIQLNRGRVVRCCKLNPEIREEIKLQSKEFAHDNEDDQGEEAGSTPTSTTMENKYEQAHNEIGVVLKEENSYVLDETDENVDLEAGKVDKDDDLVGVEKRQSGVVSGKVVYIFFKGGRSLFIPAIFAGLFAYTVMAVNDLWLAAYINQSRDISNLLFSLVYGAGCLCYLIGLISTSVFFSRGGVKSSQFIHDLAMERIMHAPITWFESTPSGRIMSRLSSDLSIVDTVLTRFTDNMFQLLSILFALIIVVCILVPMVTIVIVVTSLVFGLLVIGVDRTNREIKREANMAMSPLQTVLSESVHGRMTIRAHRVMEGGFESKLWKCIDIWNKQSFTSLSLVNFSMLMAYFLSFFISSGTGLFISLGNISPSSSGLALTYSLQIPYFALHTAFVVTIVAGALASLERLLDLVGDSVPQEPQWRMEQSDPMTRFRAEKEHSVQEGGDYWPKNGVIEFQDVTLVYRKGLEPAIKNVSFKIENGLRVAIAGRTGSGKSSTLSLLLRIIEPTSGRIFVDGLDISKVGLVTLREAFSIIPQEPLLIRGDVRKNLDPFGTYTDERLVDAILQSGLSEDQDEAMQLLSVDVGSDASTLSAGQRQLICFARSLLRSPENTIRICDEPSSNLDETTDSTMQRVLRSIKGTNIIVAHRINTIIDSDKILVLDNGSVAEFDTPKNLLAKPNGIFAEMAKHYLNKKKQL